MQFKVPQFLEIEDKIFGPFTFKQFVYLVGGGAICYVLFRLLGLVWGAIPILVVGGLSAALAFYRPNNKPFIEMLEAGVIYFTQSKLYIWKKEPKKMESAKSKSAEVEGAHSSAGIKLDGGKLRDLAWSLDVLDLKRE